MAFAGFSAGRGRGAAPRDEPQALGRGDRGPPPALRRGRGRPLRTTWTRAGRAGLRDDRAASPASASRRPTAPRSACSPTSRPGCACTTARSSSCALLDEQPMGFYPPDALVHEAQRRGIEVLPPDVNASAAGVLVTRGGRGPHRARLRPRRAGRAGGEGARRRARGRRARSARSRTSPRARARARPALERLAWSGACDSLGAGRRGPRSARRIALWRWASPRRRWRVRAGTARSSSLRARPARGARAATRCATGTRCSPTTATTGLTAAAHPLGAAAPPARRRGAVDERRPRRDRATARACGSAGSSSRASAPAPRAASCFMLLEDEHGTINLSSRPPSTSATGSTVRTEPLVLAEGVLERYAAGWWSHQRAGAPDRARSRRPIARSPRSRTSRRSTSAHWRAARQRGRQRGRGAGAGAAPGLPRGGAARHVLCAGRAGAEPRRRVIRSRCRPACPRCNVPRR